MAHGQGECFECLPVELTCSGQLLGILKFPQCRLGRGVQNAVDGQAQTQDDGQRGLGPANLGGDRRGLARLGLFPPNRQTGCAEWGRVLSRNRGDWCRTQEFSLFVEQSIGAHQHLHARAYPRLGRAQRSALSKRLRGGTIQEPAEDHSGSVHVHLGASLGRPHPLQAQLRVGFHRGVRLIDEPHGEGLGGGKCLSKLATQACAARPLIIARRKANHDADSLGLVEQGQEPSDIEPSATPWDDAVGQGHARRGVTDGQAHSGASEIDAQVDPLPRFRGRGIHLKSLHGRADRPALSCCLWVQVHRGARFMSSPVTIYRTRVCPYCVMAARLFGRLNVAYTEVYLDDKHELRDELSQRYNWQTVPMILVGDTFVGGYSDVADLERSGELTRLLAGTA